MGTEGAAENKGGTPHPIWGCRKTLGIISKDTLQKVIVSGSWGEVGHGPLAMGQGDLRKLTWRMKNN